MNITLLLSSILISVICHGISFTRAFTIGLNPRHASNAPLHVHSYYNSPLMLSSDNNNNNNNNIDNSINNIDNSINNIASGRSMTESILQAAAELTTSTSSLLGIKSIGVDYGLVRTGLAVTIGYEPIPITIVSDLNNTQLSQYIIKLAESEKAKQIIVGLPFHTNGTEAEQTIITREFANHLNCAVYAHFGPSAMPIYLFDERYTSKEAAARLRAINPRANTYKELDAESACIILEYYYGDNGLGAQRVELPEDEKVRNMVHQAWLMKRRELERKRSELTEMRMNTVETKKNMMERARLLDEKLAMENNRDADIGKKKKKKKKKR